MRRPALFVHPRRVPILRGYSTATPKPPIVQIDNGTFYRKYPSAAEQAAATNATIFPGLSFSLPFSPPQPQHWAVIGPSNAGKTTFLQILRGQHVCIPPTARSFPYLSSQEVDSRYRSPSRAIQYVGFDGEGAGVGKSATRGAYLSARYESRREDDDFSVLDYLKGNTDLNPSEDQERKEVTLGSLDKVIADLRLQDLIHMPMGNLSNGQTRRARIARALLGKPMVLLLDEPFMGLDPPTVTALSPLLYDLAKANAPRLVLALRPQDPIPAWITHTVDLGPPLRVGYQGEKEDIPTEAIPQHSRGASELDDYGVQRGLPLLQPIYSIRLAKLSRDGLSLTGQYPPALPTKHRRGGILVSMKKVQVKYGEKEFLVGCKPRPKHKTVKKLFSWDVRRGQRWGIFGPNGSGKSTLLSLINSDHPQAYSQSVEIFGRSRLPRPGQPGISIFDIQARIGQSSPEIHAFIPRTLSVRQTIENAWADTFLGTPNLSFDEDEKVDTCLRWFEDELNPAYDPKTTQFTRIRHGYQAKKACPIPRNTDWADEIKLGDLPFAAQRVALFLRAIIKKPDIVILDEAFSGMDAYVRDKCMLFLTHGEEKTFGMYDVDGVRTRAITSTDVVLMSDNVIQGLTLDQALICVSHVRDEVPGLVRNWISLPEPGSGKLPRFGRFERPLEADDAGWKKVWGMS